MKPSDLGERVDNPLASIWMARWLSAGLLWAVGWGASGLLTPGRTQLVPALAITTSVILSVLVWRSRTLDAKLRDLGIRGILALHLTRFVGAFLYWAQAHGLLHPTFGRAAGIGDLIAAFGALALLCLPEGKCFRRWLIVWNLIGLLDLVNALRTAIWLNLTQPGSMDGMIELPWVVIPLFGVPMLIASHLKIIQWQFFAR